MIDFMDGSAKMLRFGIADDRLRSLSFNVINKGGDVYLVSRESPARKISFHESGIHRYADVGTIARKPIETTTLLKLRSGRFWTVARIFFTTANDWAGDRGGLKRDFFRLSLPDPKSLMMVSVGFTNHHPQLDDRTAWPGNFAVMKISSEKFLTLTSQEIKICDINDMIYKIGAPCSSSKINFDCVDRSASQMGFDQIVNFRSYNNTYISWAHHGLQSSLSSWFPSHPVARAILQARWDVMNEKYAGPKLYELLEQEEPDWRSQVAAIRKR